MRKLDEFHRGWPQLIACTAGLGVGVIGLGSYNLGLFARDLEQAFGLTKTQYGAGYLAFTLGLAVGLQFWGRMLSRFGAARTVAASALALALCFLAIAAGARSPVTYIGLIGLLGLVGSGTSGLPYTRVVSSWFDRGRGLALGLTQVGLGLCGAAFPLLIAAVIHRLGWHVGYMALSALAATGVPIALLVLRDHRAETTTSETPPRREERLHAVDMQALEREFADAKRSRTFWLMFVAFTLSTLVVSGNAQHMAPLLAESGAAPGTAAKYISLVGIGTICVRLICGWLSDYVQASWLMVFSCLVGAAGLLAIHFGGIRYAAFYAFSVGWTFGGEIDLVSYMCTRYFGLRVFPRVYAWQYGSLCIVAGIGPFSIGWLADRFGSYQPGLMLSALLAIAASAVFALMPRYEQNDASSKNANPSSTSPQIGPSLHNR
ncbi:MFS family permease [Paraburkholderia tropica]|uniref:MFS transporter n=1 Tax=Paraburkholderia TaxID=1822464 RepID=UPI00160DDBCD|nr:MFS transporter [Paraburkholderia tropica]MBB3001479.1 MFS family permease [Paraburkholderia tropica]MBB6322794.1 MFS family permease [Paraburkholderia tropica]